jgi:hypothetical protein
LKRRGYGAKAGKGILGDIGNFIKKGVKKAMNVNDAVKKLGIARKVHSVASNPLV